MTGGGPWRGGRRIEVVGLGEDVGLELAQLGPRVDADLVRERAAGVGERAEGVGLPSGPVERQRGLSA